MGNTVSLEDEMVNLRIVSKQMNRSSKKCEKNEKAALVKLKKVSTSESSRSSLVHRTNPCRAFCVVNGCSVCLLLLLCFLIIVFNYFLAPYHVNISHHITIYHNISHHITSQYITSQYITSQYITSQYIKPTNQPTTSSHSILSPFISKGYSARKSRGRPHLRPGRYTREKPGGEPPADGQSNRRLLVPHRNRRAHGAGHGRNEGRRQGNGQGPGQHEHRKDIGADGQIRAAVRGPGRQDPVHGGHHERHHSNVHPRGTGRHVNRAGGGRQQPGAGRGFLAGRSRGKKDAFGERKRSRGTTGSRRSGSAPGQSEKLRELLLCL